MNAVAVVGAGPVGLTAALACHALGVPTVLLEAQPRSTVRAGSRALFVHRATLDRLERIAPGLGREISSRGLVWNTKRTMWANRQVYGRTYPRTPSSSTPFTSLPQTVVEDVLRQACDTAGIPSTWGDAVCDVDSQPESVRLRTDAGRTHEVGHVIAADGPRSTVRGRLGIALEGTSSEVDFLVIDVAAAPRPGLHPDSAARVFHYRHPSVAGRNVLLVPFQGGWRIDIQCRQNDDVGRLLGSVRTWLPEVLPGATAEGITWSSVYRFQQRVAARFTDGHQRVLLAGEAAHLLPPFGARGMNSGIGDAVAAAEAIRESAVTRYATERRAAAVGNVRAATAALDHLLAERRRQRLAQWFAATVSPVWPRAGRWLDAAPYGPRIRAVRY